MARALKVYRTPIGFHDAYVAAPSQKAALDAWGSDHNLFARKEAEIVTDPALTEAPLARPGEVIKRLRGSAAEQFAALGEVKGGDAPATSGKARKPAKPKPRPSRDALDRAEEALAAIAHSQQAQRDALAAREAALQAERRRIEKAQAAEMEKAARARDRAEAAYAKAIKAWRG
jgi:hypothetical protein